MQRYYSLPITAHTRVVWCPAEGRSLHRSELAASQGVATHPALASCYGSPVIGFDHLSRSRAAHMIGNGMCLPCVGAVIYWALSKTSLSLGPIPMGITATSGSPIPGGQRMGNDPGHMCCTTDLVAAGMFLQCFEKQRIRFAIRVFCNKVILLIFAARWTRSLRACSYGLVGTILIWGRRLR